MIAALVSVKRSRSGNFDQEDKELFLSLVNENKELIESGKQEDKNKGWSHIHESFNNNCVGIKRDVSALRMKLKNLKAQNKKQKYADIVSAKTEPLDETLDSEGGNDVGNISVEQKAKTPRKRTKIFTADETLLLQELVEKHFHSLDSSLTRDSLDLRNKAWETITEEFNEANVNDMQREMIELKTKVKNMKAQNTNIPKTENETGSPAVVQSNIIIEEVDVFERESRKPVRAIRTLPNPAAKAAASRNKAQEAILNSLDPDCDYSDFDDEDYLPPPPPPPKNRKPQTITSGAPSADKEVERIQKENLLLKNAVLKKKERLLELQIALAERNLRRHQFS